MGRRGTPARALRVRRVGRDWLLPDRLEDVVGAHLGLRPYARPGSAAAICAAFDWQVLDRVLAASPPPDVLVARDGRLAGASTPRRADDARRLLADQLGIV